MNKTDKKLYFVVVAPAVAERRAVYAVDIRGKLMMLDEKMAQGRATAAPLVGELPLEKVVFSGDTIRFYRGEEVIEHTLAAAFCSFKDAEQCYLASDLKPIDARWLPETSCVLEYFDDIPHDECSHRSIALTA